MQVLLDSWRESEERPETSGAQPLVMPWLFSKPFRQRYPEKVREITARLTGGYLARHSRAFERQIQANITHNTKGSLYRVRVPVLIVVGKHDVLTPPRLARELQAEMPHARVVIFEEGGHGLYWEVPRLFNQTVLDFLRGRTSRIGV
jgi:pimeloyl-ACP methyl ester carboxylesterase